MFQTYPESSYQIEDHVTLKNYILGGKGIITMKSPTGNRYKYMVVCRHDNAVL